MSNIMEKFGDSADETLVSDSRVSCDGGVLGHPKIYLSLEFGEISVCPYCSHKFLRSEENSR